MADAGWRHVVFHKHLKSDKDRTQVFQDQQDLDFLLSRDGLVMFAPGWFRKRQIVSLV